MLDVERESSPEPDPMPQPNRLICYGGPYDGRFFEGGKSPIGYRKFPINGKFIYMWKTIKVERLDFDTLRRNANITPPDDSQEVV